MGMDSRELWMELVSADALVIYMAYRDETCRTLAAKCLYRDPRTGKLRPLSHQMIGHLRGGRRRTCSAATAKAIEKALQAPPGLLFTPRTAAARSAA